MNMKYIFEIVSRNFQAVTIQSKIPCAHQGESLVNTWNVIMHKVDSSYLVNCLIIQLEKSSFFFIFKT